jgi:filamentous hemagglutinin family protein
LLFSAEKGVRGKLHKIRIYYPTCYCIGSLTNRCDRIDLMSYFSSLQQAIFAASVSLIVLPLFPAKAQVTAASDGTGTTVNFNANVYTIDGGTVAGNNQFHSFSQFDLAAGNSANFLANNANIVNVLGRITNNNPSIINGAIGISGGNTPNLYLMNPAGIVFGGSASLNVSGDFFATTATAIGFGNDNWFNAAGDNNYASLVGNPTQFAFDLAATGTIINRATLAVETGQTVGLISGTVANTGTLRAREGTIAIAAVPNSSLVRISQVGNLLNLEVNPPRNSQGQILPFTPLDLPELLTTANAAGIATNLTLNPNNTVQTNSGSLIPTSPGSVIIDGTLNVSFANFGNAGGQIAIIGDGATFTNNTNVSLSSASGQSRGLTIRVNNDIEIQDIIGDVLDLQTGEGLTSFIADADNNGSGTFRMVAGDILRTTGGSLAISAARIEASGLDTAGSTTPGQAFLNLAATSGNINVSGDISADGDVILQALQGNITVQTIWTRGGDLDANTSGLFRAESGNLAFPGLTYNSQNAPTYNPKLTQFLIQELGYDINAWSNIQGTISVEIPTYPVSIRVGDYNGLGGGIRLRHGGSIFETGAIDGGADNPNDSRAYIPANANLFNNFTPTQNVTIELTENRIYSPRNLSENASGTVGGIITIDAVTNSRARQTLQDSVFVGSSNQVGSLGSFEIVFTSSTNSAVVNDTGSNPTNVVTANVATRGSTATATNTNTNVILPAPPREQAVNSLVLDEDTCRQVSENTEESADLLDWKRQCQQILEQSLEHLDSFTP